MRFKVLEWKNPIYIAIKRANSNHITKEGFSSTNAAFEENGKEIQ